ncbi:hypothetical protein LOK49_Contig5G00011 [Camellia lanceoleosa]|nr:hypothetical protein LOK49_Contig5G00011 [Camellia lanceoleosa]
MLLGFISLLLTISQNPIAKICIPTSVGESFLPCKTMTSDGVEESKCEEQGKLSLMSRTGMQQLQMLIFVLAFFHVLSSFLTPMKSIGSKCEEPQRPSPLRKELRCKSRKPKSSTKRKLLGSLFALSFNHLSSFHISFRNAPRLKNFEGARVPCLFDHLLPEILPRESEEHFEGAIERFNRRRIYGLDLLFDFLQQGRNLSEKGKSLVVFSFVLLLLLLPPFC